MAERGILRQKAARKTRPAVPSEPATTVRKETFTLEAPEAAQVLLLGDFTRWEQAPIELSKQKSGHWKAMVTLGPGAYEYRFKVDGEWRDDPTCANRRANAFGGENCVREVS